MYTVKENKYKMYRMDTGVYIKIRVLIKLIKRFATRLRFNRIFKHLPCLYSSVSTTTSRSSLLSIILSVQLEKHESHSFILCAFLSLSTSANVIYFVVALDRAEMIYIIRQHA